MRLLIILIAIAFTGCEKECEETCGTVDSITLTVNADGDLQCEYGILTGCGIVTKTGPCISGLAPTMHLCAN
jgi:hypothetical protein